MIKGHLDLLLGGHELVQGMVPGFELLEVDPDSLVLVPIGNEPAAPGIAEEVSLQPAGQAIFAGGADEPIGDQDERPVGERHTLGLTERRVEDGPQPELVEQGPDDEDRPPGRGVEDVGVFDLGGVRAVPAEEPLELGWDLDKEVLAAKVGESALLNLAVVAIGLDDADILVDRAAGGPDFDGSEVHVVKYHDKYRRNQGRIPKIPATLRLILSLRFSGKNAGGRSKNLGK